MKKDLFRILLATIAVTLAAWLAWYLLTPASWRIARNALLAWGAMAVPAITLLLALAWALHRRLRLALVCYPLLAGLMAGAGVLALHGAGVGGLPLSAAEAVLMVVAAALLSTPGLWRRG